MCNPSNNHKWNDYRIKTKENEREQNVSLEKNQLNSKEDYNEGNAGQ